MGRNTDQRNISLQNLRKAEMLIAKDIFPLKIHMSICLLLMAQTSTCSFPVEGFHKIQLHFIRIL